MKSTAVLALVFLAACVAPAQPQPQTQPKVAAQSQAAISPTTTPAEAAAPAPPANTIEAKTAKLQLIDGFLPLYWDAEGGKLLMRITHTGEELIYATSLPAGLGSNPVGLDRAALGETMIVRFERIGPKVLMVAPNYRYRALSNDAAERRSVEDSFAKSVLWGFKVEASDAHSVLVDATDFFLSDQMGAADQLRNTKQGGYSVDKNRSAIFLERTKAFPRNTEVEATLTFETHEQPGRYVREVTPVPHSITLREHHSFVALPEPGFKPRVADPRIGIFGPDFYDYAAPFTSSLEKHWIMRHRLEKKDPNAAVSDVVKPIVYYVDNGTPEPVRSALVEGASWWSQAFEAAGFRNAFIVKVLPEGADPMDVRYNMINWIHRAQRGWSMGEAIADPRTGEIIKGNVLLGSLRIRQDVAIARGLIPQYQELEDEALSQLDPKTSPPLMALARIRQLSAHEVGHTLGLDHNMAASSYGRASVMDYPSPLVKIVNGKLDLSDAYATGIGDYDKWAIRYGYSQFAPGANEAASLDAILREQKLYISDPEARPESAAHPNASVWDLPGDPIAMLKQEIEVRRIALSEFGLRNIPTGTQLSSLEEMLVPLYLHHRYQLEAAAKSIGGIDYRYATKEHGAVIPEPVRKIVPPERQREALAVVLSTLQPSFLEVPQRVVDLIPPRGTGGREMPNTELFEHRTAPAFDPISTAMASADLTLTALFDGRRAARLTQFHAENAANPGFNEVVDDVLTIVTKREAGMHGAITRATARLAAARLMDLAGNAGADAQARAEAAEGLRKLAAKLGDVKGADASELAHRHMLREEIASFLARPDKPREEPKTPAVPEGPPIGD
jgi:hypothetical protein